MDNYSISWELNTLQGSQRSTNPQVLDNKILNSEFSDMDFGTNNNKLDHKIPDAISPAIEPYLMSVKPNGSSVIQASKLKEDLPAARRSVRNQRQTMAVVLFLAALAVGIFRINRIFIKKRN